MTRRTYSVALCVMLLAASASLVLAAGQQQQASGSALLSRDLPDIPGKEVVMSTVVYPAGVASRPHRHDAHTFVYVLEGSVVMQVAGGEPVTLTPGQTFYENPTDVHATSKNASQSEPAKILVFMLKDKGKPATRPAN